MQEPAHGNGQWATLKTSVSGRTHTHTHRDTQTDKRNATEMPQSSNNEHREKPQSSKH